MVASFAVLLAAALVLLPQTVAAQARQGSALRQEGVMAQPPPYPLGNSSARVYRHRPHGRLFFSPYSRPAAVISPYGPIYYYPPRVVEVTEPYFCALHNVGFVTRAGMLDHLAGTHKYPLQRTVYFCPDGAEVCVYPFR